MEKKSAHELRKELGLKFPVGLSTAGYDQETYLYNQIEKLNKRWSELEKWIELKLEEETDDIPNYIVEQVQWKIHELEKKY